MISLIIPNYNNAIFLDRLFNSIFFQTYKDYEIIFIDDVSTDESLKIAERWRQDHFSDKMKIIALKEKRWNGGARNVGLDARSLNSDYTMFIDSDDWFSDNYCFEYIIDLIKENNYPDLVRLSYYWCGSEIRLVELDQKTPQEIVKGCDVACWTKCIKSNLMVKFPENTLMEDVVQHIKQLDIIKTVAVCLKGICCWNRKNPNSCSTNAKLQNEKWLSSLYRFYADLLDLTVNTQYCKNERERRLKLVEESIKFNMGG